VLETGTRINTRTQVPVLLPGSKSLPEHFCQKTCRYSVFQQQYTVLQTSVNCGDFTHISIILYSESNNVTLTLNGVCCLLHVLRLSAFIYLFITPIGSQYTSTWTYKKKNAEHKLTKSNLRNTIKYNKAIKQSLNDWMTPVNNNNNNNNIIINRHFKTPN